MTGIGRVIDAVLGRRAPRRSAEQLAKIEAAAQAATEEAARVLAETERIRQTTRGTVKAIQRGHR